MDVEKCHDEVAVEDRTGRELAGEDSTKDTWIHASPFWRTASLTSIILVSGFQVALILAEVGTAGPHELTYNRSMIGGPMFRAAACVTRVHERQWIVSSG